MKNYIYIAIIILTASTISFANKATDKEMVEKTSILYLEGFIEGDAEKFKSSLDPSLNKFGYWQNKGKYGKKTQLTYDAALKLAQDIKDGKHKVPKDAIKKVEVIDVLDKIAISRVHGWWGVDFMLLAKNDGKWLIRQIIWEGPNQTASPSDADKIAVKKAGLGYIEGFYEGDESKLRSSLRPSLYKFGYGIDRKTGKYRKGSQMTFEKAIDYTKWVRDNNKYAKKDAPKKVEVLEVRNKIAAVKVTAFWGVDFMLLSKIDDKWMIDQVIWASQAKAK